MRNPSQIYMAVIGFLVMGLLAIGVFELNGNNHRLGRIEDRQVEVLQRVAQLETTIKAWDARLYVD